MQLIDKENDILHLANLIHHGLDPFFKLTAVLRARHHQGKVESDDALVAQDLGHVAATNLLGETFHDRGLADSCLTHQHRVILGAAAENLDHALNFSLATDDGIELAFARKLGEIAPKGTQGGRLGLPFATTALHGREVGIDLGEDLVARALNIDIETLQHAGGHSFPFPEQSQ